jgi:hypothetical protein
VKPLPSYGFCASLDEAKLKFADTWRAWLQRTGLRIDQQGSILIALLVLRLFRGPTLGLSTSKTRRGRTCVGWCGLFGGDREDETQEAVILAAESAPLFRTIEQQSQEHTHNERACYVCHHEV